MLNIILISEENEEAFELRSRLEENGFACAFASPGEEAARKIASKAPDLVLVDIDSLKVTDLRSQTGQGNHIPVIALVRQESLGSVNEHLNDVDDFILRPFRPEELELRIKRLLRETTDIDSGEIIRNGDLAIDLARYEVSLAGRPVELTFREYELLKFLVENRGRVSTRETLLNKVWGYDYFGGDRTVDVHIRRLRSKIEDLDHQFIETVRNIGYRFRDDF